MSWYLALFLIVLVTVGLLIGNFFYNRDAWQCPKCRKTGVKKGNKKVSTGRGTWGAAKIVVIDCECRNCGHKWQIKEEIDQTNNT